MLRWTITFLVIAFIAALLGFTALAGTAAAQEPPRPQDPAPDPKAGATLDPELRTAIEAFQRVESYRFRLDGKVTSPWNTAGAAPAARTGENRENVAAAKEQVPGGAAEFKLDGAHENERPLHITGGTIEAFRSSDRIAYREKGGEWGVMPYRPALPVPAGPGGGAAEPAKPRQDGPPEGDLRLLPVIVRFIAPKHLLADLQTHLTSCTRVAEDKDARTVTFECLFKPAAGPLSKLRIVVKQGAIDEITFDARPPSPAAAEAAPQRSSSQASSDAADTTFRYKVMNFNDAHVEVPEEVARLLGR